MPHKIEHKISSLLKSIEKLKQDGITSNLFHAFLTHAKNEAAVLLESDIEPEVHHRLIEIRDFRPFDELGLINRFFIRLLVFRFQFNWYGSWKTEGKYWNDLHSIELKLLGIQYRLKEARRNL